jgi:hypothetical protein
MANTVTATLQLTGSGTFEKDTDLTSAVEAFSIGSNDFDEIKHEFTNGTGNNQINSIWFDERTIAASGNDDLDLAGGLTDVYGATITFAILKIILIDIDTPDGTKSVLVGPAGVANGFQGPFGGTGATVYLTVKESLYIVEPWTGWTVTAGTGDILRVTNGSGAASVIYRILLGGEV